MTSRAERLAERFAQPAPSPARVEPVPSRAVGERVEARWEDLNQRFTVWLPRQLVAEAKAAAARRGESIATLVARAIQAELSPVDDGGE